MYKATDVDEIKEGMNNLKNNELSALIIYTKQGSREDLGRPTTTPIENKEAMMAKFNK